MAIQGVGASSHQQHEQINQAEGRFSVLTNQGKEMLRRLGLVIIPALALIAFSNMPTAEAGPRLFVSCIARCAQLSFFSPSCWAVCLPLLAFPEPRI